MKYTSQQIYEDIREFCEWSKQDELHFIIPYCLGRFGYITRQIWDEIHKLIQEGVIKRL